LNTWSYLAATYNGSRLTLYVNGNRIKTKSVTGRIATSNRLLEIGGDSVPGQSFNGLIDEVRVYNHALTQSQVRTDMRTPISYPSPTVISETPVPGATGVSVSTQVTATFNEAVQSGTIGFTLTGGSGSTVAATVAYNSANYTATLTPSAALAYSTTYTATIS